jgi:Tol biopolymer transport system component
VTNTGAEAPLGGHFDGAAKTVSADGRFVVFTSRSQLAPGDTRPDDSDVYIRDRIARTTELVSVGAGGVEGFGDATEPTISSNGEVVAFTSTAALAPPAANNAFRHIYVRDLAGHTTELVSLTNSDQLSDSEELQPSISKTGAYVTFISRGKNLRHTCRHR